MKAYHMNKRKNTIKSVWKILRYLSYMRELDSTIYEHDYNYVHTLIAIDLLQMKYTK